MKRLAIIASHPIQYYAPWFQFINATGSYKLKVFYLWDFGATPKDDPKFQKTIHWDISLLDGYDSSFSPNTSNSPGTHHFSGLINPHLTKEVLDWKPDAILFTTLFYLSPLISLLNFRLKQIPCLFRGDSHLIHNELNLRTRIKFFTKRIIFSAFSALLPVGTANKDYFIGHSVEPSHCFLSPHCVDNERFGSLERYQCNWLQATRTQLGLDPHHTVFLFVGKFEAKKRPDLLVKTFLQLTNPDARLILVGDGERGDALLQLAKHDHRIHILPFQNQSLMPAIYRLADCLVLPSYGSGETWGLCVNEAMASGIPAIVSSHVGCAADLIVQDKTGWIFDADSPQSLLAILSNISRKPELLTNTHSHLSLKIKNYSYETATQGLFKALESLK